MAKDCLYCCGCIVVVLLNICFMLIGLVLLAIGGILIGGGELVKMLAGSIDLSSMGLDVDIGEIFNEAAAEFVGISTALIIMGAIVFVLSILGMCGSCCKAKLCLIIYVAVICALFLAQIILVAIYFGNKAVFEEQAKKYMTETIKTKYSGDKGTDFASLVWGILNLYEQCCGVENGEDFKDAEKWTERMAEYEDREYGPMRYPLSCCKAATPPSIDDVQGCIDFPDKHSNWKTGCYNKLDALVGEYILIVGQAVGGICGAQAILIIIVIFMILCLKDNKVE